MSYLVTNRPAESFPPFAWGMGDAAKGVQVGASVGTPLITGVLASQAAATAAATGAPALILGMAPALAIPIIGAAIAGITIAAVALIRNSGCGPTCVAASGWANQAEPLLKQNVDAYFSNPVRTRSMQNTALSNFEVIWAQLEKLCSQPDVGDAGKACINDRKNGACKWKATADSPWPNGPKQGECWNWFNAYRDPIARDMGVVSDSEGLVSQVQGATGGNLVPLLLVAGLVALAVSL